MSNNNYSSTTEDDGSRYNSAGCIVEIQAGAGGVESMDWSEMLFNMYCKWASKRDYSVEIVDQSFGEVAGIKSVTFNIQGER